MSKGDMGCKTIVENRSNNINNIDLGLDENFVYPNKNYSKIYQIGDKVLKYSGDYQLEGEIRSIFTTKTGKTRYVVEHEPGFLHIYSENNIKLIK